MIMNSRAQGALVFMITSLHVKTYINLNKE